MSILKCYYCEVFAHIPVKYQQQQTIGRFLKLNGREWNRAEFTM